MSILLSVYLFAYVANTWTVGRISLTFRIQEFVRHRPVSGEYQHSRSKTVVLQMGTKTKSSFFSKAAHNSLK
jgi:hypothetical protein